jgi:hypothetical protein
MRVSKASWVTVLAVIVGLAGLVQWRASAAEGQQEERKAEPEKKPQPAAAGAGAKRVTSVYLRAEAVGHDLNYVPSISSLPRVQGELVRIDADWVVLSGKGKESMVAKSAVLMIVTEGL